MHEDCTATPEYTGHTIDYLAAAAYHKYRQKKGDRQVFCRKCQRWKYPTHRDVPGFACSNAETCANASTVPRGKCIRCEKRRPAKYETLCRPCIEELDALTDVNIQ